MAFAMLALAGVGAGEPERPISERLRSLPGAAKVTTVTARLITQHAAIQPGGSTRVGVQFTMEPGWHIYTDPPGDAGLPTRIRWECGAPSAACSDASFGPLAWPPAEDFLDPGDIRTRGYTGTVLAYSTLRVSDRVSPGNPDAYSIRASVTWLACKDVCIPGGTTLNLELPLSPGPPEPSADAALFKTTDG